MVKLIGNVRLVAKPELKDISGTQLAVARCAWDTGYGDKKVASFAKLEVWGKRAEVFSKAEQGQMMGVNGDISLDSWDKPDGTKGTGLKIRVDDFDFGKLAGESNRKSNVVEKYDFNDDDIPFEV